jgi:dTDP-4-amino-4,6-dideoxygalactose transaminase
VVGLCTLGEIDIMIPVADPKAQYLSHKKEIDAAVSCALDSGCYILGLECESFGKEFAAWQGTNYCIGVGNGTDALHLALSALNIGTGDEVITVSHTAVATVSAIELAGAEPVLVDIDPNTYTMDPQALEVAITPRSKAIIPVHLYGHPADMPSIMDVAGRHNLFVVEDCAQAHGATLSGKKVGTFGHIACFSFYPTKNLGALGDGGAVTTDDEVLANKVRLLRQYGWKNKFISDIPGRNSRLDELQAAVLRVKLPHLDEDNAKRGIIAGVYAEELKGLGLGLPNPPRGVGHVYHLYVVRTPRRNHVLAGLMERGVGAAIHYPQPLHLQPAYRRFGVILPETERAAGEILSLPMFPELDLDDALSVTVALKDILSRG